MIESIRTEAQAQYGPQAAETLAEQVKSAASQGAEVLLDGGRVVGIGLYSRHRQAGRIGLVHVLPPYLHSAAYHQLVDAVVSRLRQYGVTEIVCEGGTLQGLALGDALTAAGFTVHERAILSRPAGDIAPPDLPAGCEFVPLNAVPRSEIATVVFDAFAGGPDAAFDYHFRSPAETRELCDGLFAGQHGPYRDELSLGLHAPEGLAGIVFATVTPASHGFILLVAVSPAWQGRGLGHSLMLETIRRLYLAGCPQVDLAVTVANLPAWHLYRRMGFTVSRFFSVYHLVLSPWQAGWYNTSTNNTPCGTGVG